MAVGHDIVYHQLLPVAPGPSLSQFSFAPSRGSSSLPKRPMIHLSIVSQGKVIEVEQGQVDTLPSHRIREDNDSVVEDENTSPLEHQAAVDTGADGVVGSHEQCLEFLQSSELLLPASNLFLGFEQPEYPDNAAFLSRRRSTRSLWKDQQAF